MNVKSTLPIIIQVSKIIYIMLIKRLTMHNTNHKTNNLWFIAEYVTLVSKDVWCIPNQYTFSVNVVVLL